jgi:O-antigen/teichoic acid export membrane protein
MAIAGSFARNVVLTFAARAVTTLSGVVLMIAAARLLGPAGKGEYAYLMTIIGLGTQFGAVGVGTANLYYSSRDPTSIGKLLMGSAGVAATAGAVYFVLLALLSIAGFRLVSFDLGTTFLIACAVAIGLVWMHGQNLLVGVGEVIRFNVLTVSYSLITLACTVASFWFLPGSSAAIVGALLISGAVVVATLWSHVTRGRGQRAEFDADLTTKVLRYGFIIYISHAIAFLLVKVDLLLVQYYLDSYDLGLYSAAGDFAQAIVQLQAVVNMLMFPKLAALASEAERRVVTKRLLWRALFAYVILIAVLVAGAEFIVGMIFGSQFMPTAAVMLWLMPGAAALAIASISQNHMGAAGRPVDMIFAPAVALVAHVSLCVLLIPRYGISGAAMSSCVAFGLMGIVAGFKALRS